MLSVCSKRGSQLSEIMRGRLLARPCPCNNCSQCHNGLPQTRLDSSAEKTYSAEPSFMPPPPPSGQGTELKWTERTVQPHSLYTSWTCFKMFHCWHSLELLVSLPSNGLRAFSVLRTRSVCSSFCFGTSTRSYPEPVHVTLLNKVPKPICKCTLSQMPVCNWLCDATSRSLGCLKLASACSKTCESSADYDIVAASRCRSAYPLSPLWTFRPLGKRAPLRIHDFWPRRWVREKERRKKKKK